MRDRLIELIRKSGCVDTWNYHADEFKEPNPIEELADHLLKNGVIVPPCKVGDTVYFVCGYNMAEYKVYKMEYDCLFWRIYGQNNTYVIEHREFVFFDERIGKTVFLKREEAEKALKGGVE